MTENIEVTCLLERYWDPAAREYAGTEKSGTLLEICMQSSESDSGRLIPAGVVLLSDNTFESVPLEFMKKTIPQT